MKINLVVFDVDGTLYNKNILNILISIEIFFYLLFFPFKYREIYFIWSYRKNRKYLSGIKNYSLSEQEYLDHKINFNFSLENKKQIVSKWMIHKPLKYLKILKYSEVSDFIEFLNNKKINYVFYSDYPVKEKLDAMKIKYRKYYYSNQSKINILKPNLKGIQIILNENNIKSSECLIVGDRDDTDGVIAREAKTSFINYPKSKGDLIKQFTLLDY